MGSTSDTISAPPTPTETQAKPDRTRWLVSGFKLLVSVSLIWLLISRAEVAKIWQSMASANMLLIVLSFLLHGVGYFSSSYRWQILMRAQGFDVPLMYLMRSYAVAMFFNNLLPSTIGGDGYRALDTSKCNIPKMKAFAIVVVERFLGMFALLAFAVLALTLATELTMEIENLWLISTLAFSAMLAVIWLIFFRKSSQPPNASATLALLEKIPAGGFVQKQVMKIQEAFAPFRGKSRALAWSLGLSLLLQFNVIFHYYLISDALGLTIPFAKFLVIIPLAMFIQMVPLSINGIGIRESFYVFFLSTVYGMPYETSLAFSWIAYGMILLLGILGGIIYAFRR